MTVLACTHANTDERTTRDTGNEVELASPFRCQAPRDPKDKDGKMVSKHMDKSKKTFYIFYEEQSLSARRERVRGLCSLDQTEWMHVLTRRPLVVPTKVSTNEAT